jgi:Uma2 family endonuclease
MTATAPKPMTIEQFLDWEETQSTRFEFDGFQPIAMTGGTANHAKIQGNIAVSMISRLRRTKCSFLGSDLKIEVVGKIRYPDGFVLCSPLAGNAKVARDPVVIFEVLSNSTAQTDLVTKNQEYAATASVQRYIILSQSERVGTMFERIGGDWVGHLLDENSVLKMAEIGIEVPLREFYEDVEFD